MFLELNFPVFLDRYTENAEGYVDTVIEYLQRLRKLGWDGVALNLEYKRPDIAKLDEDTKMFLEFFSKVQHRWEEFEKGEPFIPNLYALQSPDPLAPSPSSSEPSTASATNFKLYKRLTVTTTTKGYERTNFDGHMKYRVYDLIAVRVQNFTELMHVVDKSNPDIIVLKPWITLKNKAQIGEAYRKGIFCEVSYGHALTDEEAFRDLMKQLRVMMRMTKGKNLILASGNYLTNMIRSPLDIANIMAFVGADFSLGKLTISTFCKIAISHGDLRRTVKSAIKIVPKPSADKGAAPQTPKREATTPSSTPSKGKKKRTQSEMEQE